MCMCIRVFVEEGWARECGMYVWCVICTFVWLVCRTWVSLNRKGEAACVWWSGWRRMCMMIAMFDAVGGNEGWVCDLLRYANKYHKYKCTKQQLTSGRPSVSVCTVGVDFHASWLHTHALTNTHIFAAQWQMHAPRGQMWVRPGSLSCTVSGGYTPSAWCVEIRLYEPILGRLRGGRRGYAAWRQTYP
jgi:hypothetical protein